MSSQADTREGLTLTLAALTGLQSVVLKDEGHGAARVLRFDLPDGAVVLKEWRPEGSRLMAQWARLLMRREIRHYRLLRGVPGIPAYLGHEGDHALLIRFVDGQPVHRQLEPALLRRGLDALDGVLTGLHERRFVHLDLHQKLNALIDREGRAWLIDLGQGLDCSRGLLAPLLFRWLTRIDRNAVLKFRARYAPDTLDPARREQLVERFGGRSTWWPKLLGRRLRRLIVGER